MNQFPIFIPTKGRYKIPYTIRAFEKLGIPYTAVVEQQEFDEYQKVVNTGNILVLPHRDKGLTVTRNWIWDYAQNTLKTPYFWTFDDNIRRFYRYNNNRKIPMETPVFLEIIEDWMQRWENVYITGMQYNYFVSEKSGYYKPIKINQRVYSNMLIKTDIPYRNELFYNDDTDLCIRVLKDGHCTALFYTFLAGKIGTLIVKGGMTDFYEKTNKRLEFAKELQKAHPDITKIVWRYGRWHHEVDYSKFKNNKLIPNPNYNVKSGINNYGMELINI